jgi:excisionase family DNA binding protein
MRLKQEGYTQTEVAAKTLMILDSSIEGATLAGDSGFSLTPHALGPKRGLMTVGEVSEFLNVSRAQAYLIVRADSFPLIELGPRLLRVDPSKLEQWLEQKAI